MTSERDLKLEDLDQPSPPPGYGDSPPVEAPLPWLPEDLALRDYFAAHALTGLLAGKLFTCVEQPNPHPLAPRHLSENSAAAAYKIADAMLRFRKGD